MNYAKDGITVAPILDTVHPKKDGSFPVRIRVTFHRRRQYFTTGKSLSKEEWESLATTKIRHLSEIRKDIENSYSLIRKNVEELASKGDFSFHNLNCILRFSNKKTINALFKEKIDDLQSKNKIGTMWVYGVVLKGLERFSGKNIQFVDISKDWVYRYEQFLRKEGKSQTTISIHLRHLRAIINDARRAGIMKESQYPFGRGKYEIQSGVGRKMALTVEQIGKIARYETTSDDQTKYRDYWFFLYLCNGINVADFIKLKYSNIQDNEIYFIRQKTAFTAREQKEICATITPPMQAIIDKWGNPTDPNNYIFPILSGKETELEVKKKAIRTAGAINRWMKKIAEALGIERVTTYTAVIHSLRCLNVPGRT